MSYEDYQFQQRLKRDLFERERANGTARYEYLEWEEGYESKQAYTNDGWPNGKVYETTRNYVRKERGITWERACQLRDNKGRYNECTISQI